MADIKLLEPQRLTDNPDGGGLATNIEIPDGVVYNLLPAIDRIDRVNGNVSLRKMFVKADSADTDTYNGLHVIIKQPPADSRVSAVLFRTAGWADVRSNAQSLVERYLDASVQTRFLPYDRQLAGQRAVILFGRVEASLPEIGETYVLTNETLTPPTIEFIRVQDMRHEVQTFTDAQSDYVARVVTLTITQPLSIEFAGSLPNRMFAAATGKSIVRGTIVSDAARYKGITPLAVDANIGDLTLRVESIYSQLAPSAASEAAVLNAEPAGKSGAQNAATARVGYNASSSSVEPLLIFNAGGAKLLAARSIERGSVAIGSYNADGISSIRDEGGKIYDQTGRQVGTVDYASGAIASLAGIAGFSVMYRPAAIVSKSAVTAQQYVSQSTRGYVYVQQCIPLPQPGSASVSFRAAGKWYELTDDGIGVLSGATGVGSGSVNYTTGDIVVTLGALPDIGSSVIFAWGGSSEYAIRTGDTNITAGAIEFTIAAEVTPGTLSLSWPANGVTKTATDSAGVLSGHGTGRINYETGEVRLVPTLVPDAGSTLTASYNGPTAPRAYQYFTPSAAAGSVAVDLAAAVRGSSVRVSCIYRHGAGLAEDDRYLSLTDTGAGGLRTELGVAVAGASINYGSGLVTLPETLSIVGMFPVYAATAAGVPAREETESLGYFAPAFVPRREVVGWVSDTRMYTFLAASVVSVSYLPAAAAAGGADSKEIAVGPLRFDLTPASAAAVVPGSVYFTYAGRHYIDRAGSLYYGHDATTGAATLAGTIDYASGVASITSYATGGTATAMTNRALLVELHPLPIGVVHGRTAGAPLRPGSFSVRALRYDTGAQITATADNNGKISTANMHGYADANTGVFSILFGAYVLDSSLSADDKAEPWYNSGDIVDGYIFRPREIIGGSLRYSCVVQTTLPLNPDIIGLNPVRLPLDGRVQSIRAGDTLVIHDSVADTLDPGLGAEDTAALSRTGIASVVIYDQNDVRVDEALYTVDKAAGTVTFVTGANLSAYTQPLIAVQTIEDMALCTDAQITGDISIAQPLTHGYTAANSYVSSALVIGDAQARYQGMFALNTWASNWDATSGTGPTSGARYNDLDYPVVVNNRDAIAQRWRLQFTSSTAFNIVSEQLGVIGTGTISTGAAPTNPATGQPYFTIAAAGFGTGWATGNAIRFDTIAAGAPVWVARTNRPGPAEVIDDMIKVQPRWDKD